MAITKSIAAWAAICVLFASAVYAQTQFDTRHIAKSAYEKMVQWQQTAKAEGTTFTDTDLVEVIAFADAYILATENIEHPEDEFARRSEALDAGKRLVDRDTNLTPEEVAALDPLVQKAFGYLSGT